MIIEDIKRYVFYNFNLINNLKLIFMLIIPFCVLLFALPVIGFGFSYLCIAPFLVVFSTYAFYVIEKHNVGKIFILSGGMMLALGIQFLMVGISAICMNGTKISLVLIFLTYVFVLIVFILTFIKYTINKIKSGFYTQKELKRKKQNAFLPLTGALAFISGVTLTRVIGNSLEQNVLIQFLLFPICLIIMLLLVAFFADTCLKYYYLKKYKL